MIFCNNCGNGLPDGAKFCPECAHPTGVPKPLQLESAPDVELLPAETESTKAQRTAAGIEWPSDDEQLDAALDAEDEADEEQPPPPPPPGESNIRRHVTIILGAALLLVAIAFLVEKLPKPSTVVLRLHGSKVIGNKLMPELAEAYLRRKNATNVRTVPDDGSGIVKVQGVLPGNSSEVVIEIALGDSGKAFRDLVAGKCDIGFTARRIKADEKTAAPNGPQVELSPNVRTLALNGLAVIVHRDNDVKSLSKQELIQIFTRAETQWHKFGSSRGDIVVYAPAVGSETYEAFKERALDKNDVTGAANFHDDCARVADHVADDPRAIGFVELPYANEGTRKIPLRKDEKAEALAPNEFTLGANKYLFTSPVYLYKPANPASPHTLEFLEFALEDGQAIVRKHKFVESVVERNSLPADAPDDFKRFVEGADWLQRYNPPLQFASNSSRPGEGARAAAAEVVNMIRNADYTGPKNVLLAGFTDDEGDDVENLRLSRERAREIAKIFEELGIRPAGVEGFGHRVARGSNDDEVEKEKNRRVEIWLRP